MVDDFLLLIMEWRHFFFLIDLCLRWLLVFICFLYFVKWTVIVSTVGFDDYGSECDGIRITAFLDAGQDNLTPLGRLEKYAFSENVFNR